MQNGYKTVMEVDMEEKITELETKFSFQEDLLQELNEIVIRQQQQLDEIIGQMRIFKEQLEDVAVEGVNPPGEDSQHEKPPHY